MPERQKRRSIVIIREVDALLSGRQPNVNALIQTPSLAAQNLFLNRIGVTKVNVYEPSRPLGTFSGSGLHRSTNNVTMQSQSTAQSDSQSEHGGNIASLLKIQS